MKQLKVRTCKICNTLFMPTSGSQKCCSKECGEINKKMATSRWNARRKFGAEAAPIRRGPAAGIRVKETLKERMQKEHEKRVEKERNEMARLNSEARALGLSYGKYIQKLEFEMHKERSIEYMLKSKRRQP